MSNKSELKEILDRMGAKMIHGSSKPVRKATNKYCVECGRKLIIFKVNNDWDSRKLHKTCWTLRKKNKEMYDSMNIEYEQDDKYDEDTGLKIK